MFYHSVEAAYRAGEVTIGLPAVGEDDDVYVEAKGVVGWQTKLLSKEERRMLADYSVAEVAARTPVRGARRKADHQDFEP